jgi:hypothetical protein
MAERKQGERMADIKYQEQADAFQYDLSNLIHRYREEFDLTDYTIAGLLDFAKLSVLTETDEIIFDPESTEDQEDSEASSDIP